MRIYVTHMCPKDRLMEYGLSLSASNFNYNLIAGGGFDKVYSIYPGYTRGELDKPDDETFEAVYSSWRKKGKLKQRLARFVEQYRVFKLIPKNANIWFYNVTTINFLTIILLKILKPSCSLYIIELDFTPNEKFNKMMLPLINSVNGRICLSTYEKFNKTNSVCLPGVIPNGSSKNNSKISHVTKDVLISGALKENITMLGMVLEAFAEMPDINLHISGVLIDYKDKVIEYSERYPNIHFYGKLPMKEYVDLLQNVPISLNTRKPSAPENKCNFPSKVIEAFCHNRIVASTIHYPQLDGLKYFDLGSDKESFKTSIRNIFNHSNKELLTYANQGEIAEQMYSANRWFAIMDKIEKYTLSNSKL